MNEAEYDAAVASLNALLDAGAADETHPLADLAAKLGELIGDYDAVHYPGHDVAPPASRPHDAAVVDMLKTDPEFADAYLAAAMDEAAQPGGQAALLAALRHVAQSRCDQAT